MFLILASKSADPDEKLKYAAFHLGLHCLPKYSPNSKGWPLQHQICFENSVGQDQLVSVCLSGYALQKFTLATSFIVLGLNQY